MTISNANKQAVCEKYRIYLEIIYSFGNKVMLMKQLYHYAQMMGIAKSYSAFYSSIIELVDADIFRKESFNAFGKKTQLQMLVMRKYGIRFLEEKPDSYSVASVKKAMGNERILVSIFKNQYILNKIIPRIQKEDTRVTLRAINDLLERDHSTILHNKNQGLSFLEKMKNEATLQKYLDMLSVEQDIDKMQKIKQRMGQGLRKGSKASDGKGRGRLYLPEVSSMNRIDNIAKRSQDLSKEEKIDNYTIDTMLAFNAYVAQIRIDKGQVKITVLIFDIFNRSNVYKVATHIACMHHMFTCYFQDEIELKVGVVSIDGYASNHLKTQAESATIDFVSKERRDSRLSHILEKWHVDRLMKGRIEVHFVDYNITDEFLDGIKHANLVRR
ncbi:hypothetical protein ASD24_28750 [Paenibacillus sp. Root52]|uniref:hypothetical protein n=1 Tax=Paenibacillus sp. Root52 TaxID=1736552 RepID=UPI0006F2C237|nr:hypothetical protein [Paenibacillus sp. Root52]KQY85274.1 hypothetical protein ASD24_28750 [Paenibacillus sp. Root52]